MNHDCKPKFVNSVCGDGGKRLTISSTFYRLRPQALVQQVIALRDIEVGEEITHSCESPHPIDSGAAPLLRRPLRHGPWHALRGT